MIKENTGLLIHKEKIFLAKRVSNEELKKLILEDRLTSLRIADILQEIALRLETIDRQTERKVF